MTKQEFCEFCETIGGAELDYPFTDDFDTTVARHENNRKWFAIAMLYRDKWIINLKCEPMEADFLRSVYEGVIPAYHMNKVHWNSVFLESDVPDEEIKRMIMNSFSLTEKTVKKSKKSDITEPKAHG